MAFEMVASNACVGFESISPLIVHLRDAPHDLIGAQRRRHGGLLCDHWNTGSQQNQRRQKPGLRES
jgi:hypothetical protein